MRAVAAVDLGATSGRVMVGHVGAETLRVRQVARFANGPVTTSDGLHWNGQGLHANILEGLREAANWDSGIASVGVDSWGVDYGLLRGGRVLCEPFHYRDDRTARGVARVHQHVEFADLYARNGLQFLPFNTVYQLAAEEPGILESADAMLLIPDLIGFYLAGTHVAERTNASTTALLRVADGRWDTELMREVGLPVGILPPLVDAGSVVGAVLPAVADRTKLGPSTPLVAVGSHDTASAVVATPMADADAAYVSCGTWGLVGIETEQPILTDAAREANFTNEGGVDGRVRFLHNVMGLWLLSESVRAWSSGGNVSLERLLAEAEAVETEVPLFDANDERFLAPGDMPARIEGWLREHGLPVPATRAAMTRCIVESLAQAFADSVATAGALSGRPISRIHVTGGGALNTLLCQRTADRAGLPVVAGPVEATAIGNVLVQGRAIGAIGGTLESMRALVARTFEPRVHQPRRTS